MSLWKSRITRLLKDPCDALHDYAALLICLLRSSMKNIPEAAGKIP